MPALPPTPIYHAAPPEVNSTLLNTGGTAAGITAAGTSWSHVAAEYVSGIAELEAILASVQATYQGPSAEKFVAAHQPMLMWMQQVVIKATLAAVAHGEIAISYESAVALMPTMLELINNHVVHGVLVGTNFFGVNTIPIGMNEADYVRMWNQAADVQTTYDFSTGAAVASVPETLPAPMTLIPGVGETGSIAATAAGFFTQATATATGASLTAGHAMSDKLIAGKAATAPLSVTEEIQQAAGSAPTEQSADRRRPSRTAAQAREHGHQHAAAIHLNCLQRTSSGHVSHSRPSPNAHAGTANARLGTPTAQQHAQPVRRRLRQRAWPERDARGRLRRHRRHPGFQPRRHDQPRRRRSWQRSGAPDDAVDMGFGTDCDRGHVQCGQGLSGGHWPAGRGCRRYRRWRQRHDGVRRKQPPQQGISASHYLL